MSDCFSQACLHHYEHEFMELACRCPAVVCCRCSPQQKAEIVKLLVKHTGKRTCAIGATFDILLSGLTCLLPCFYACCYQKGFLALSLPLASLLACVRAYLPASLRNFLPFLLACLAVCLLSFVVCLLACLFAW